eukprot:6214200-Pleurochrysis_carterae.AAC.5
MALDLTHSLVAHTLCALHGLLCHWLAAPRCQPAGTRQRHSRALRSRRVTAHPIDPPHCAASVPTLSLAVKFGETAHLPAITVC